MRKSRRGHLRQRQRAVRSSADQTSGAADARPRERARASASRAATNARRSPGPLTPAPARVTPASHNPAAFNGFKLKAHYGGSAETAACQAVEALLDQNPVRAMVINRVLPNKIALVDIRPAHYQAIKKLVNFRLISRSRLRFAHDPLFGVGAGCFAELLAGTTCRVTTLNAARDPNFGGINPEPVEKNYAPRAPYLKTHPHD